MYHAGSVGGVQFQASMHDDVVIVGAGPAGSWAAFRLAREGARVRIVDPSHPREKPCGGGLTRRTLQIIHPHLPLEALPVVAVNTVRFRDSSTGTSVTVSPDAPVPAFVVSSRTDFDGWLLRAACRAGAVLDRRRVTDVQAEGPYFQLATTSGPTVRAPILIGADGANSIVRRRLAVALRREQLSVATGFFAYGRTSNQADLELMSNPPGYLWSFPRPDHLAIGICADIGCGFTGGALRSKTAAWILATGVGAGTRLRPYAWPVPSMSSADFDSPTVAGPGWMLIGDAAGLVDPITREGIFYALASGDAAATAVLSQPARPDDHYESQLRVEVLPELSRAAAFKTAFFHSRFRALLIEALRESPQIQRVLVDLIAGTQPYRGLRRRLARTGELGLAWRWLAARPPVLHAGRERTTSVV